MLCYFKDQFNPFKMLMKNLKIISLFTVVSSLFLLSGCTSNQTIGGNTHDLFTKYEYGDRWKTLVDDEVVAFGKPTTFLVNEPKDAIVIAGKQYSYVLNKGGSDFFNLISQLNPDDIQLRQDLNFVSPDKDSHHFTGYLKFSYTPSTGSLNQRETLLFKQYGILPCDCRESTEQNQHYIFQIKLEGNLYPVVENLDSLKPLSKPYKVRIQYYQDKREKVTLSTQEKLTRLPLVPFTLAIDALVLPAQIMGISYQP